MKRKKQTTKTITKLMGGKLRIEQRNGSPVLYARAFFQGKNRIFRTGETTLVQAKRCASEWYLDTLQRVKRNERLDGALFSDLAEQFLQDVDESGRVGEEQRKSYHFKWSALKSKFQGIRVADIDTAFLESLRAVRAEQRTNRGTPIKAATLKKDLLFVSQVMRFAKTRGVLASVPDFPTFNTRKYAIAPAPRPFLTYEQYRTVQKLAKARAEDRGNPARVRQQRLETYHFLLICVGAALRVGEAYSLRWCDCELIELAHPNGITEEAVRMEVLGKHSKAGQRELAYGIYGAVHAYKAMKLLRPEARPEDPLFTETHRDGINELLLAAELKHDPKTGRTRDTKSLRPTGISMRLELGDNISYRDIARWARTSVAMVEQFYDQNHPELSAARVIGFRSISFKRDEGQDAIPVRVTPPARL